jgi:hypothetical protein
MTLTLKIEVKKDNETFIYSTDLGAMKDFYMNRLGLDLVSAEEGRHESWKKYAFNIQS